MHLSIVFPAYNEEGNIREAVESALAYLSDKTGEVIVINDGSHDQTGPILDQLAKKQPKLRVFHHPRNFGYAPTLRDGFREAKGEWIFYSDSDNQFALQEIDLLFELSIGADIVVGYRKNRQDPATRKFAARVYNLMVRTLFGFPIRDVDCAFKLFHRRVFERITIESKAFTVDTEIMAKAQALGMTIREIGVTHFPRKHGESTVRLKHIFQALAGIFWLRRQIRIIKAS